MGGNFNGVSILSLYVGIKNGDFIQYTNDKNHYLQKRLDTYVTPTTDAIIDLGSGWGRHGIQLSFNNPNGVTEPGVRSKISLR